MYKIFSALMTVLILTACTSKEEKALMHVYEKNKTYHKLLQKTEKIQLYEDKVTKVLLTATYLHKPTVKKDEENDELFIVGFLTDTEDLEGLEGKNFSLTLDGKSAKSMKVLDGTSKYLKNISFTSEWSKYYLFHFPHTSKKNFKLVLESRRYGKGVLYFSKVAKYVLSKKGI